MNSARLSWVNAAYDKLDKNKDGQVTLDDIAKIIDTYRNRVTEDKYSYVATMEEIRENDYNLNIPRYVDTFEEEEPVDLTAVASEMKALDSEMQSIDATIQGFCNELGIESPF